MEDKKISRLKYLRVYLLLSNFVINGMAELRHSMQNVIDLTQILSEDMQKELAEDFLEYHNGQEKAFNKYMAKLNKIIKEEGKLFEEYKSCQEKSIDQ